MFGFIQLGHLSAQTDSLINDIQGKLEKNLLVLGENHLDNATLYDSLGALSIHAKEYVVADSFYRKALHIKRNLFGQNHTSIAKSYFSLARLESKRGNFAKSDSLLEIAGTIFSEYPDKEKMYYAHCNLARSKNAFKTTQFLKADSLAQISLQNYLDSDAEKGVYLVDNYHQLARNDWRLGNYKRADRFFTKAVDLAKQVHGEGSRVLSIIYHNFGLLHMENADLDLAENYIQNSIDHFIVKNKESAAISTMYNNLGVVLRRKGLYRKSNEVLYKALDSAKQHYGERSKNTALIYHSLGIGNSKRGLFREANALFIKSLDILLETVGPKNNFVGSVYSSLGECAFKKGDFQDAISYGKKALDSDVEIFGKNHRKTADSYFLLARRNRVIGDYDKAIRHMETAIDIFSNNYDLEQSEVGVYYSMLGQLYSDIGDFEKAEFYIKEADKILIAKYGDKSLDLASSYNNLGAVYNAIGKYDAAKELFSKALEIWTKNFGEKHYSVASVYNNLGQTEHKLKNYDTADKFFTKAIEIDTELYGGTTTTSVRTLVNLTKVQISKGNFQMVDSLWTKSIYQLVNNLYDNHIFLPEDQRIKYVATFKDMHNDFFTYASQRNISEMNTLAAYLLLNSKSLALDYSNSVRKMVKNSADPTLQNDYQNLKVLSADISQAELLTKEERKASNLDLIQMKDQMEDQTERLLQHESLRIQIDQSPKNWNDVHQSLGNGEAMLDFVRFFNTNKKSWEYYVVISSDTAADPQFVYISDEDSLVVLLEKSKRNDQPAYIQDKGMLKKLYSKIWTPVVPYLDGNHTIHLSATGLLHRIDFEALQNENDIFLAEQFKFFYYKNLRELSNKEYELTISEAYQSATLLGDISYDELPEMAKHENPSSSFRDGIDPLPATLEEINFVADILEKSGGSYTLLRGEDATESAIQNITIKQPSDIYHFATHAKYLSSVDSLGTQAALKGRLQSSGNPLQRSMLMLSGANTTWTSNEYIPRSSNDGVLTAYEVLQLDLSNTKLVVLSACNTGLGDIHDSEGVIGLQSAFKQAGVKHVLVSLWKVNDVAAKDLMIAFYTNLIDQKQDASTALRNAKTKMREQGAKPANWAGFILL